MALSNQRFVTTWTSEDSIQWRMYIIPSSVDYISPALSSNVTLPSEFLLRDMSLDTELGSIPAGLVSQVLKINVNIAALQGSDALNDLRVDLLQGTTTKKRPLNSDGTPWIDAFTTTEQTEFDAFNTFVLQYNDGSGWKVAFIGCQKYSAENELEITALDNVITFTIEIYDIQRCIGEAITPHIWSRLLMRDNTTVNYSASVALSENTQFNQLYSGFMLDDPNTNYAMLDILPDGFSMYISTFARLKTKIGEMYSKYLRALTSKLTASFVCHDIFTYSVFLRDASNNFILPQYLCYVSEIYDNQGQLVGGALGDSKMFAQFTNFYEAYKMLCDNALETVRPTYSFTSGTPDAYTLTMVSSNPYPALGTPSITFDQQNTYSNFKIKMFSEVLNQVTTEVTSITGNSDTTSFPSGKQGTSGDNSKDLKIMFHNVPQLTSRSANLASYADIPYSTFIKWQRNTINSGYLLYFEASNIIIVPKPIVNVFFGGEDYAAPTDTSPYIDPSTQVIWKQQNACLPQTISEAMVNFLGRKKQAEATLTTNFTTAKFTDVGKRCTIDLVDYNTLLESIYGEETALAVMTKHSHKVYEGMCDITLRIDAESE
jgi:hypothetical protein